MGPAGCSTGIRHAVLRRKDRYTELEITDGRIGKRLYGRVATPEFHIILVVNPGDTLHTVTTVYEVDRKDFPDGRTRRRKR